MTEDSRNNKPVDRIVAALLEGLEAADCQLDSLVKEMANILRPGEPAVEETTAPDSTARCKLVEQLSEAVGRLSGLTAKMREVQDRLEV